MVKEMTSTGVSASLEDYLEAIYWLSEEHRVARSRDIAKRLDVSKSSVTSALKQLNADGYVNYDPYSFVTLTEAGEAIARDVARRHAVLQEFLYRVLGLAKTQADQFACAIEHSIDRDVLTKLEAFMAFLDTDDPDILEWLKARKREREAQNDVE